MAVGIARLASVLLAACFALSLSPPSGRAAVETDVGVKSSTADVTSRSHAAGPEPVTRGAPSRADDLDATAAQAGGIAVALADEEAAPLGVAALAGRPRSDLLAEIERLLDDLGGSAGIGQNQPSFEIRLLVDQLLAEHPKSREALLLRRGRLFSLDLTGLIEVTDAWAAAHPDLVESYRMDPSEAERQVTQSTAAIALPGVSGLVPTLRSPALTEPGPTTSWFRAPKQTEGATTTPAVAPALTSPGALMPNRATSRRDLFDRLKAATVLVVQLGRSKNGQLVWRSHGTGSFISPTRVLTNTHVVESQKGIVGESFLVISKVLGVSRANVLARGEAPGGQGVDAAILDVLDYTSPTHLPFTDRFAEGVDVVLSGYAGKANIDDRAFAAVKEMVNSGVVPTADNIPTPKFSSGAIQAVFISMQGEETVAADVEATGGASGSPIVNGCGEIVAILYAGTTAWVDSKGYVDASTYNMSASARELTKWLDSVGVPYARSTSECSDVRQ